MVSQEHARFRSLFEELMGYALNRGIRFVDAQDLVAASIEAAFRSFDPARGAFAALCQTALSNRIKNYWRDRKPLDPLPEDDSIADGEGEEDFFDESGYDAALLGKIMAQLTDKEKEFLLQMQIVLEEFDDRAVSETSRRLGIEPSKGWDIFRRIQRKAGQLKPPGADRLCAAEPAPAPAHPPAALRVSEQILDEGAVPFSLSPPELVSGEIRSLARFAAVQAGFAKIVAVLDDKNRAAIEALL
jgi:DNA-directed RNA polymerase specialized sigma24 family protein